MANKPLTRPYFWGGTLGGGRLTSHEELFPETFQWFQCFEFLPCCLTGQFFHLDLYHWLLRHFYTILFIGIYWSYESSDTEQILRMTLNKFPLVCPLTSRAGHLWKTSQNLLRKLPGFRGGSGRLTMLLWILGCETSISTERRVEGIRIRWLPTTWRRGGCNFVVDLCQFNMMSCLATYKGTCRPKRAACGWCVQAALELEITLTPSAG